MHKYIFILFIFLASLLFSQQTDQLKIDYHFPKLKSSITLPVKIPLPEVSNIINSSVPDLIFQDDSYADNDNDQFKVKVWKTRPIRLVGGTKQNVLIEVPLKIWAEKGLGTLGIYTYQSTTFETVMYFNTEINFNNNWKMTTKTTPMGFKWVTKPVLDYGKVKIPITNFVESSLKKQQIEFTQEIDKMMTEQLDFQKYAVMAWNQFADPFAINADYNTWLKISPVAVKISPLVFYGNRIDAKIGIDVYSETFTGSKPPSVQLIKKVPNFIDVQQIPNKFLLQTTANIPFSEATTIAEKIFLGKVFDFREGKSKIKITSISVYGENEKITIEAETEGAINGTSFITGLPVYDAAKQKIVLSDIKFNLKTKNILHKAAALLFQKKIVKMIEEEYGIPTEDLEKASKKNIEEAFNRDYYKGIKLNGKVLKFNPTSIIVNPYGFTVIVNTEAQLEVLMKGF